jgi:acyl-CoA dehydrogenase
MFQLPPRPEYFSAAHEAFRASVRRFVGAEIAPHASAWDEAGTFPRELYRRAAEVGITGIGYPEALGGTPADIFFRGAVACRRASARTASRCRRSWRMAVTN